MVKPPFKVVVVALVNIHGALRDVGHDAEYLGEFSDPVVQRVWLERRDHVIERMGWTLEQFNAETLRQAFANTSEG